MPRRRWWENTKSRKLALTGAIGFTLLYAVAIYYWIGTLIEGTTWQILRYLILLAIGLYAVVSWWTNWHKLRSENH